MFFLVLKLMDSCKSWSSIIFIIVMSIFVKMKNELLLDVSSFVIFATIFVVSEQNAVERHVRIIELT